MARPSRSDLRRRALLAAAAAVALALPAAAAERIVVFAAASLKRPLDEIAAAWDGGAAISYGASGALARQVAAGAPADVVLLAAVEWMDWLREQGALAGPSVVVASNTLVLIGPADAAPLVLDRGAVLVRLGDGRLAIGDPASVPAGRYGRQALEALGLWDAVEARLLAASDVRAALAYVEAGEAPLGLVYGSDAVGAPVAVVADLPDGTHDPVAYPGAVVAGAGQGAQAFLDHVAASQDVFAAHGFGR